MFMASDDEGDRKDGIDKIAQTSREKPEASLGV